MPPHALIIEDDRNSQEVLTRLLSIQQFEFTTVGDPQDLTELLPTLPDIQVAFLDLEMPHMNGYDVLAMLKSYYGDTVPVIAYTVHTSEAVNALELGFDGFLGKPVSFDDFPTYLDRILHGERVWASQ
jgi:CheY-like chemotaxis protein